MLGRRWRTSGHPAWSGATAAGPRKRHHPARPRTHAGRAWLARAARPSNDGLFNLSGAANTEMQTEFTLRKIRASTGNFLHLPAEGRLNLQACADGASIRLRPLKLESDPIPGIARFIVDQPERPIYVIDQYV